MYSFILPTSRFSGNNLTQRVNILRYWGYSVTQRFNILSLTVNKEVGCSVSSLLLVSVVLCQQLFFSLFFHFSFFCSLLPHFIVSLGSCPAVWAGSSRDWREEHRKRAKRVRLFHRGQRLSLTFPLCLQQLGLLSLKLQSRGFGSVHQAKCEYRLSAMTWIYNARVLKQLRDTQ